MRTEPISLTKGDTWINTLPITESDGSAYDLTGATVWLTVKAKNDTSSNDDDEALFQLIIGSGITVASPATGIIAVEITDEQTELLTAGGLYKYDVQVRKGGKTFTPIGGTVVVNRDVTRA
jgi:hypothetical protein